jgi:hypothetical protein
MTANQQASQSGTAAIDAMRCDPIDVEGHSLLTLNRIGK